MTQDQTHRTYTDVQIDEEEEASEASSVVSRVEQQDDGIKRKNKPLRLTQAKREHLSNLLCFPPLRVILCC